MTLAEILCRGSYLNDKTVKRLEKIEAVPVVYLPDRPEAADLDWERVPS